MTIPHEFQKQYDATKSFVQTKSLALNKKMKLFKGSIIFAGLCIITMCMVGGFYFILSLFALCLVGTVYSRVAKMKKEIKEPKEMVTKYDNAKKTLDKFEANFKFELADFFLGNLFEYMVRANDEISTNQLFDKLQELEYQPLLDFYTQNGTGTSEGFYMMRNEYFFKNSVDGVIE